TIRRLCVVAAQLSAGRGAGATAGLVAGAALGGGGLTATDGSWASGDPEHARRKPVVPDRGVAGGGLTGFVTSVGDDDVYDAAVGVQGAPVSLQRSERYLCGQPDRGSPP